MGWSSGAQLLDEIWTELEEFIPKKQKEEIAKRVVNIFEAHDADTISSESEYAVLRKASCELNGYNEDDEDDEDDDYEDEE